MSEHEIQRAIALARAGDKVGARETLFRVVAWNPDDETAWGWLAACARDQAQRRYALGEVLRINPGNQHARAALERIQPAVPEPKTAPTPAEPDRASLMETEVRTLAAQGWEIVHREPGSVQMRKRKTWNRPLLFLGLATLCLGVGILPLLLAAIQYAWAKDQLIMVTPEEIAARPEMADVHIPGWFILALVLVLLFTLFVLPRLLG